MHNKKSTSKFKKI